MDDIETTNVLLPVHNDTSPAHVASAGDHDDVAGIELDEVGDLALLNIELDSVVNTDERVGVADGAAVVGDDVGNTTVSESDTANLQELVGGFLGGDAVDGEAALDIVEETEVLARLLDRDDVYSQDIILRNRIIPSNSCKRTHVSSRVGGVGADLSIDFDQSLLDDCGDFTSGQGVL